LRKKLSTEIKNAQKNDINQQSFTDKLMLFQAG